MMAMRLLISSRILIGRKCVPRSCSTSSNVEHLGKRSKLATEGPGLEHFLANAPKARKSRPLKITPFEDHPYIDEKAMQGNGRKVYFDVYGCQMNVNDTEVVWAILKEKGFQKTSNPAEADVWLVMTCSIREGAENKVWGKLNVIKHKKTLNVYKRSLKVGLMGCMAERLKDKLLQDDRLVDVVAGPDSYRDLPRLLAITSTNNQSSINVMLSLEETYADVTPIALNLDKVTGFVSIQRGCDNMCSYCIVPFTRGKERSRPLLSILNEVKYLRDQGVKEVTLLGQNVNSYLDVSRESISLYQSLVSPKTEKVKLADGFKTIYKAKTGGIRFADLLEKVSEVDPEMRIRFVSPHPKDFPDEVLRVILEKKNICNNIHLPAQSGNSRVLEQMRRGYSREAYIDLVHHIREIIPQVSFSSDFIAGFCGETAQEFEDTLSLIKLVQYHKLFLFPYSLREATHAHRRLVDDVPVEEKNRRSLEMHNVFRQEVESLYRKYVGTKQLVLIEGDSKRSSEAFQGRNDDNVKVIFPKDDKIHASPGDYCLVQIEENNSQVLKGSMINVAQLSS